DHARLDLDPAHLVPAGHDDLDHATARLPRHLEVRELRLRLLHALLHGLGLLHEIPNISAHRRCLLLGYYLRGRTVSGTTLAPKRSLNARTVGSLSSRRRALSRSSSPARSSACAGVSPPEPISNSRRME